MLGPWFKSRVLYLQFNSLLMCLAKQLRMAQASVPLLADGAPGCCLWLTTPGHCSPWRREPVDGRAPSLCFSSLSLCLSNKHKFEKKRNFQLGNQYDIMVKHQTLKRTPGFKVKSNEEVGERLGESPTKRILKTF